MFKSFLNSYQYRIFFFLFAFLSVSFLTLTFFGKELLADMSENERGNFLVSFTKVLDSELPSGGYDEILEKLGLENATREEKLKGLGDYLRPFSDRVSTLASGLGVGYYSSELDAIITYGPSSSYEHLVGVSINADHPGREVMATNTLIVNKGAMVRGEILNAMLPIEREGKVIGYIWANQLAQKLDEEFENTVQKITIILGLCFLAISFLLALLAVLFLKDVGKLVTGVENIRKGTSNHIKPFNGKLGEVAQSINSMTDQIARANADSARAMLTLQNILDNVDVGIFIYDTKKKEIVYANKYTQSKLGLAGILGETFAQTFYGINNFSQCPCFDELGQPNFDIHRRDFFIGDIKKNVTIIERLITWHDGRLLLMLVVSNITTNTRDENV